MLYINWAKLVTMSGERSPHNRLSKTPRLVFFILVFCFKELMFCEAILNYNIELKLVKVVYVFQMLIRFLFRLKNILCPLQVVFKLQSLDRNDILTLKIIRYFYENVLLWFDMFLILFYCDVYFAECLFYSKNSILYFWETFLCCFRLFEMEYLSLIFSRK